jgi:hypothetical protein
VVEIVMTIRKYPPTVTGLCRSIWALEYVATRNGHRTLVRRLLWPLFVLPFLLIALLLPVPASAGPVVFTDRAAFDAAVGPTTLFSEFHLEHVPLTYDFAANFAGLAYQQEGFEIEWGDTLGINGLHTESRAAGLYLPAHQPIVALGFDLLDSWTYAIPASPVDPPGPRTTTDAVFRFETAGGVLSSTLVAPGSFFGVLLYDDAFAWLTIATPQPDCFCRSGLTIDNLAVAGPQPVSEAATVALLGLGLCVVGGARRWRR